MARLIAMSAAVAVALADPVDEDIRALQEEVAAQASLIEAQEALLQDREELDRRLLTSDYFTQGELATAETYYKDLHYSMGGALSSLWMLLCGALVMFMHAGFAMLETGCCRAKNASNVLMKNLVNVCVGTLGWWSFGWAFAYGGAGDNGFIGYTGFFGFDFYTRKSDGSIVPVSTCDDDGCQSTMLSWFFQWAFCTAAATIVSGAVAERVKSPTYACFAFLMSTLIYPVVVAWTWGGGWLYSIFDVGVMDFAGSGIVHMTGGVAGLAGTVILGPRKGRFENPDEFVPHNLPLAVLGTFALWFGWYGFNPGSTLSMKNSAQGALAAQVAMNTTISAATGGIVVFILRYLLVKKYDVGGLCNGILAGLVSITAGCGNMESGSAFATGFVGAIVYQGASMLMVKFKIDDPVDACPVHGACGMWGVFAAGVFDWGKHDYYHGWSSWDCMKADDNSPCTANINGSALGANLIMILMIILWSGGLSAAGFFVLMKTGKLRIDEYTEEVGMDSHHHSPPKAYCFPAAEEPEVAAPPPPAPPAPEPAYDGHAHNEV